MCQYKYIKKGKSCSHAASDEMHVKQITSHHVSVGVIQHFCCNMYTSSRDHKVGNWAISVLVFSRSRLFTSTQIIVFAIHWLTSGVQWDTPSGLFCLGCRPVNNYWFPLACADPTPTWVIIKPFPCDDTALRFHQLSFSLMNVPCVATPSPCDIHTRLRVLVSVQTFAVCGYKSTSKAAATRSVLASAHHRPRVYVLCNYSWMFRKQCANTKGSDLILWVLYVDFVVWMPSRCE